MIDNVCLEIWIMFFFTWDSIMVAAFLLKTLAIKPMNQPNLASYITAWIRVWEAHNCPCITFKGIAYNVMMWAKQVQDRSCSGVWCRIQMEHFTKFPGSFVVLLDWHCYVGNGAWWLLANKYSSFQSSQDAKGIVQIVLCLTAMKMMRNKFSCWISMKNLFQYSEIFFFRYVLPAIQQFDPIHLRTPVNVGSIWGPAMGSKQIIFKPHHVFCFV